MNIKRPMCVISLAFTLGIYIILSLLGGVEEGEYEGDLKSVRVTGKITDKVIKNDKYSIHLKECVVENKSDETVPNVNELLQKENKANRMIVYLKDEGFEELKIGQKVVLKGTYQNFSLPENDGQFNMRRYYRIRGYEAFVTKAHVIGRGKHYSKYKEWLFLTKEKTKRLYGYYMDDEYAGTLSAMVLGDKTGLDEDVKDLYQAAGISHILSLSGLHIATVGMFVFTAFCTAGVGSLVASIFSTMIMISYGVMTGLSTSTIRALVMFLLAVVARNIGRTYDLLSGVCLSSILLLFENPYYVYDSGFLMSYFSVIGIALIYPVLFDLTEIKSSKSEARKYISKITTKKDKVLHKARQTIDLIINCDVYMRVRQSVCISLAASIATFPVVINSFYKTSRYSMIINIVVVPLMSIILGMGIISGIIGNSLVKIPLFRGIVFVLLSITQKIIELYSLICEKIIAVRGNVWIVGKSSLWQNVVYITIVASVCYLNERKSYRQSNCENRADKVGEEHFYEKTRRELMYRMKIIMLLIMAVLVISVRKTPEYEINVLSVGQGACNVIRGKGAHVIMIDGGSTDVNDVYKYRICPFILSKGIDEIDYVFVTHPDADHISGIKEMLEDKTKDIRVNNLVLSVRDDELMRLAKENGVKTHIMYAGDRICFKEVQINCVSPSALTSGNEMRNDADINDLSLVLRVDYGDKFSAIFPGDISSEVEKGLVKERKNKPMISSVDFLSVPHHGSKYSSCEDFLQTLNPRICTISSGAHNSYGHPHKETLERLDKCANDSRIFRTDKSGQITIMVNRNIMIRQFRERDKDD